MARTIPTLDLHREVDVARRIDEVENYNWADPFSNFFPGIAGNRGIPLWLYYVSRGQAVSSFGVRDKDGQILEFYSFNKAVMRVAREGFRTFVRLDGGEVYEPFQKTSDARIRQQLVVSAAELHVPQARSVWHDDAPPSSMDSRSTPTPRSTPPTAAGSSASRAISCGPSSPLTA